MSEPAQSAAWPEPFEKDDAPRPLWANVAIVFLPGLVCGGPALAVHVGKALWLAAFGT